MLLGLLLLLGGGAFPPAPFGLVPFLWEHDTKKEEAKPLHAKGGRGKQHQPKGRRGESTTTQRRRRPSSNTQREEDLTSVNLAKLNFVCEHSGFFE